MTKLMSTPFDDELVTLAECPPGLFEFDGSLGFKTEYGMTLPTPETRDLPGDQVRWTVTNWPDAYCLESGECFWGGATTHEERAKLLVRPLEASPISEMRALLDGLAELLACSVLGGVHFMVEPELSYVDTHFTKRSQAHALSSLLCGLHPVDEEGCFVHGQPISEERVKELIELGNNYRATLSKLRDDGE